MSMQLDRTACVTPARRRALAVDDHEAIRAVHRRLLTMCGVDAAVAANGREAVDAVLAAAADGRPFDLLLMDVQMPVVDGWTAAATVRRHGYAGQIVMVSGDAELNTPGRCVACGVDQFILKPARAEVLMAAIRSSVTRPAAAAVSEAAR